MSQTETISRVADEYGLSSEQAREILLRAADQEITSGTPPQPAPPTEEEIESILEGQSVTIYGVEYSLEPSTVSPEQIALINGLLETKAGQAENAYDTMMATYGTSENEELSAAQAQYLIQALQGASSDPAWNWKFNTFLQSIDPIVWILGLGIGVPTATKYLAPRFVAYLERRAAAKLAERAAAGGAQLGMEIAARQAAASAARAAAIEASEAAAIKAASSAAAQSAGRAAAQTATTTGAERLAAQAATTAAEQAARRSVGQAAAQGLAKTAPYVARGTAGAGALLTAALPFQLAYMYLQPQAERYLSQNVAWRMDPSARARLVGTGWGGYQEGGGGAYFGGTGRMLYIPGITEPWREV